MGIRINPIGRFDKIIEQYHCSHYAINDKDLLDIECYSSVILWFREEYSGDLEYTSSYSTIYFEDEKDAVLFLLKCN